MNDDFDPQEQIRTALNSRARMEDGIYCECSTPDLRGVALMCFACECRNRDQELAAIRRIVDAHPFEQDPNCPPMCVVCTGWEDAPRHHGIPAEGRTSWGTAVQGIVPAPADPEEDGDE